MTFTLLGYEDEPSFAEETLNELWRAYLDSYTRVGIMGCLRT